MKPTPGGMGGVNKFRFTHFPDNYLMFYTLTKISVSLSRANPDMQLQRLLEFLFLEKQLEKPEGNLSKLCKFSI